MDGGSSAPATARLYFLSNIAGALEPCGCTKEQLGGIDRLGGLLREDRGRVKDSALVSVGPTFFGEPKTNEDIAEQEQKRADAMARALRDLGLSFVTPGSNDLDQGAARATALVTASGAVWIGAETRSARKDVGGIPFGFIGVGPKADAANLAPAIAAEVLALRGQGARVFVLSATVNRGVAKRLADAVPDLDVIALGAPTITVDADTPPSPPEIVGKTLVIETSNHLQHVAAVDYYVVGDQYTFQDAEGIERLRRREDLSRRIEDLRKRIVAWESDPRVTKDDLSARRADLAKLEKELADERAPVRAVTGSHYRYVLIPIGARLPKDPTVVATLNAYYKDVNDTNRTKFANKRPRAAKPGEASYLGAQACAECHKPAFDFWKKTRHARAYETLSSQHKEFNLDCVSCHVTGYDKPGGSTVTFVDTLKDVQCETCHGPGSLHKADPTDRSKVVRRPKGSVCVECHHPPHVADFDPERRMKDVLGPGHGLAP